MIARAAWCGIMLIHHKSKNRLGDSRYEGKDDTFGSFNISAKADSLLSIYKYNRAAATSWYKLVFSKLRHAADMRLFEIERMSGAVVKAGTSTFEPTTARLPFEVCR